MFERYPPSSVRALFVAKSLALSARAESIDVEHLVAGAVEAWPAAGSFRAEVLARVGLAVAGHVPEVDETEIPFSALVKWLLHRAMIEADALGHHRIRPEHLLLAVLEEPECSAFAIMREAGLDRELLVRTATEDAKVDDSPFPLRKGHYILTSRPEREKT